MHASRVLIHPLMSTSLYLPLTLLFPLQSSLAFSISERIMENCSLDLCLSPVTSSLQSYRRDSNQSLATRTKVKNEFYNGEVREYDLVEVQIRAVIEMASKERGITALESAPVRMESPLGFSVKRSVERFLEKRKKRCKLVTPYSYTCSPTSSSSSHHF